MRSFFAALTTAFALVAPCGSNGATFTNTLNAAIPDDDPLGLTSSIDASGFYAPLATVTWVSVTISIGHSYVGDLAIELTSPAGTELQIMARPGSTATDEQTGSPWGDSSNLSPVNLLTFADGAATSAESLGAGIGGGADVPASAYFPDADGWATDLIAFSGFDGERVAGDWTLKVADYGAADTGTLVSWTLVIVPEPEPAALLAAGLAGLGIAGRRRA